MDVSKATAKPCELETTLRARMEFLPQPERDLVEAVVIRGCPAALVARMRGERSYKFQRRLRRILSRMKHRDFRAVMIAAPYMDETKRRLAVLHYCHGKSQRLIARESGESLHGIRRRLAAIEAELSVFTELPRRIRAAAQAYGLQSRRPDAPPEAVGPFGVRRAG